MDFKIAAKLGLAESRTERKLKINSEARNDSELIKLTRPAKDVRSVTDDAASVGASALARNAEQFAGANSAALDQVRSLTAQQLSYSKLAEATADSRIQSEYASEINTLQTEINRVVSSASYNGANPVSGGQISIDDDASNFHRVVQVANNSGLYSSTTLSSLNQNSAATLTTTLKASLSSARIADNAGESRSDNAAEVATATIPKSSDPTEQADAALASIEDAAKLAEKVAQDIRDKYTPGNVEESLISSSLERDRVKDLLA